MLKEQSTDAYIFVASKKLDSIEDSSFQELYKKYPIKYTPYYVLDRDLNAIILGNTDMYYPDRDIHLNCIFEDDEIDDIKEKIKNKKFKLSFCFNMFSGYDVLTKLEFKPVRINVKLAYFDDYIFEWEDVQ